MPGNLARAASVIVAGLGFVALHTRLSGMKADATSTQVVESDGVKHHERVTTIDTATGLGNERSFELELERAVKQAQRHANTVALSLVDVDAYDLIRGEYGEMVAEKMLAELATFIGGRRADDRTFRLNGGRFAIILPYTTAPEIFPLMEHLRTETEGSELGTTVTIGTAHVAPRMDSGQLLQRARQALTEAHVAGGNTVVTFDPACFSEQRAPIASPA